MASAVVDMAARTWRQSKSRHVPGNAGNIAFRHSRASFFLPQAGVFAPLKARRWLSNACGFVKGLLLLS